MSEITRYFPSDMQLNLGKPRIVFTEHSVGQLCMYEDVEPIVKRNKELEADNKELKSKIARLHKEESEEQSFMYGDWEVLAWTLCEEECGEDSCSELVWEGHPPEPWGERYLKYEYEVKVMIEKVRKFAPEQKTAQEIPAELIAWVRIQRNDIPATGEEFANAIELWLEDKRKGVCNINGQ